MILYTAAATRLLLHAQNKAASEGRRFVPTDILDTVDSPSPDNEIEFNTLDSNARSFTIQVERAFSARTHIDTSALVSYAHQLQGNVHISEDYITKIFETTDPLLLPISLVGTYSDGCSLIFHTNTEYRDSVIKVAKYLERRIPVTITGSDMLGKSTFCQDVVTILPGILFWKLDLFRLGQLTPNKNITFEEMISFVRNMVGYCGGILLIDGFDAISRISTQNMMTTVSPLYLLLSNTMHDSPIGLLLTTANVTKDQTLSNRTLVVPVPKVSHIEILNMSSISGRMPSSSIEDMDNLYNSKDREQTTAWSCATEDPPSKKSSTNTSIIPLKDLGKYLSETIKGQDESVSLITDAIQRAELGLRTNPEGPAFVGFLLGPTGTGKTLMAETLSKALGRKLLKLDMGNYAQGFNMSSLIGSPHGYIGYGEGGVLTNAIISEPTSVILLDEMEKADHQVHQLFLGVLDRGTMRDGKGRIVNFKDTIILMTSNVGARTMDEVLRGCGFSSPHRDSTHEVYTIGKKALGDKFSPEFVNRIDTILTFNRLSQENLISIAEMNLRLIGEQVGNKNIILSWSKEVPIWLVQKMQEDHTGAANGRALRRTVRNRVTSILLKSIDTQRSKEKYQVHLQIHDGEIVIQDTEGDFLL